MPTVNLYDAAGTMLAVEVSREALDRNRGVLEALAADDAPSDIRLADIGFGTMPLELFARALRTSYALEPWERLLQMNELLRDPARPQLAEAISWLNASDGPKYAAAFEHLEDPGTDMHALRLAALGTRFEGTKALFHYYTAANGRGLLGLLLAGDVPTRAAAGEPFDWALARAAEHGDVDSLRYLWHLTSTDRLKLTYTFMQSYYFSVAAKGGHLDAMRWFWSLRAHDIPMDPTGNANNCFRVAAINGHLHVLEWLWSLRAEAGLDIDPTAGENAAFQLAGAGGHTNVLRWLWSLRTDHGVAIDPTAGHSAAFRNAMYDEHIEAMEFLYSLKKDHGVAINMTDDGGETWKHPAAIAKPSIVAFLASHP